MIENPVIRVLTPDEAYQHIPALADILVDCVAEGSVVSFMAPLSVEKAQGFWQTVADGVVANRQALLIAEDRDQIQGTVQIMLSQPENQPHRASIAKMLVHRRARRQGIGAALLRAAEATALAVGKRLLILDTSSSDAERLYQRMGWTRLGTIPDYALSPDGGQLCPMTYYYKSLSSMRTEESKFEYAYV